MWRVILAVCWAIRNSVDLNELLELCRNSISLFNLNVRKFPFYDGKHYEYIGIVRPRY